MGGVSSRPFKPNLQPDDTAPGLDPADPALPKFPQYVTPPDVWAALLLHHAKGGSTLTVANGRVHQLSRTAMDEIA